MYFKILEYVFYSSSVVVSLCKEYMGYEGLYEVFIDYFIDNSI